MTTTKARNRKITANFFEVQCGTNNDQCFCDVVKTLLANRDSVESRNLQVGTDYHRLYGWESDGKVSSGALLRLRPQNHATVATLLEDEIKDLELRPGEVLTEFFCFAYFSQFRTLVLHRNRDAGGASRLSGYVQQLSGVTPVVFSNIITRDGMKRLMSMETILSAEIKIAMPKNLKVLDSKYTTVKEMIDFAKRVQSGTVRLEVGMGYSRQPLDVEAIKDVMQDSVTELGDSLESASVRGRVKVGSTESDIGDIITVDLIEESMRQRVDVADPPTIKDICDGLKLAYQQRFSEIRLLATAKKVAAQ